MTCSFDEIEAKISTLESDWQRVHVLPHGTKLYHFTSPEGLAGILNARALWASLATAMGDGQELKHLIQSDEEKDNARPLTQYQTLADALFVKFLPDPHSEPLEAWRVAGGPFIASFCSGYSFWCIDKLYQWRTFGREGSGYALAFDYSKEGDECQNQPFLLRKVLYGTQEPEELVNRIKGLRDAVKETLSKLTRAERNQHQDQPEAGGAQAQIDKLESTAKDLWVRLRRIVLELTACVKAKEFAVEEEWRLILTASVQEAKVRSSAGGIAPYVAYPIHIPEKGHAEVKSSTAGPRLTLKEVIIGPAANARITKPSLEFLLGDAKIERDAVRIEYSGLSIR